jgi:hypothetical protein
MTELTAERNQEVCKVVILLEMFWLLIYIPDLQTDVCKTTAILAFSVLVKLSMENNVNWWLR